NFGYWYTAFSSFGILRWSEESVYEYEGIDRTDLRAKSNVMMTYALVFEFNCKDRHVMNKKDIIIVNFNYRLGVHDFLCLGTEDAPGNTGMKDQVQKNIASFDGNPDDVTIIVYSAKSASVDLLMLSKSAEGLFQRVVPEIRNNKQRKFKEKASKDWLPRFLCLLIFISFGLLRKSLDEYTFYSGQNFYCDETRVLVASKSRCKSNFILRVLLLCVKAALADEWREVETAQGIVRGRKHPTEDIYTFYNIPYATAPVGVDKFNGISGEKI
ncbi:hypothetical protein HW555_013432, partial [Spodoptera exigua]